MWSLDKDASVVHINVEKNKEIMWKSVFTVCFQTYICIVCIHLLSQVLGDNKIILLSTIKK